MSPLAAPVCVANYANAVFIVMEVANVCVFIGILLEIRDRSKYSRPGPGSGHWWRTISIDMLTTSESKIFVS